MLRSVFDFGILVKVKYHRVERRGLAVVEEIHHVLRIAETDTSTDITSVGRYSRKSGHVLISVWSVILWNVHGYNLASGQVPHHRLFIQPVGTSVASTHSILAVGSNSVDTSSVASLGNGHLGPLLRLGIPCSGITVVRTHNHLTVIGHVARIADDSSVFIGEISDFLSLKINKFRVSILRRCIIGSVCDGPFTIIGKGTECGAVTHGIRSEHGTRVSLCLGSHYTEHTCHQQACLG